MLSAMSSEQSRGALQELLVSSAQDGPAPEGRPRLVGLVGPPGVGKSTVASQLAAALPGAVVLPMDGFHLANAELARLGRAERKGAPDTFDVDGFVALLARIRTGLLRTVYAPRFHRELEESIAGGVVVLPSTPDVIVEGNYLLLDSGGWEHIRPLLDVCWYLEAADDRARVQRLIDRHVAHGRSRSAATEWVERSDETNARIVASTRARADRVLTLDW